MRLSWSSASASCSILSNSESPKFGEKNIPIQWKKKLLILKKLLTYSLECEHYGRGLQQTMKVQQRAQGNLICFGRLCLESILTWLVAFQGGFWFNSIKINCLFHSSFDWFRHYTFRNFLPRSFGSRFLLLPQNRFFPTFLKFHNEFWSDFDSEMWTIS